MAKQYWLFKSEPDLYSFDDLKAATNKTDYWDGIRNYQARNFLRDTAKKGDAILFYHSRTDEPGVVGIAEIAKEAYPDHTAWDKDSKYFDPKSSPENPRWVMVDIKYKKAFKQKVTLKQMKAEPKLDGMLVIKKGQRLSIQPVTKEHFDIVCEMGGVV